MSPKKPIANTPTLPGFPNPEIHKSDKSANFAAQILVKSNRRTYKGGRILPYALRFRYWRTTEGLSIPAITTRLENRACEFGVDPEYLQTRLYELNDGRFKPPTWLVLLLIECYGIKFPWSEFLDNQAEVLR